MSNGCGRFLVKQPRHQLSSGLAEMFQRRCGLLSTAGLGKTGLPYLVAWDQGISQRRICWLRLLLGLAVCADSFHWVSYSPVFKNCRALSCALVRRLLGFQSPGVMDWQAQGNTRRSEKVNLLVNLAVFGTVLRHVRQTDIFFAPSCIRWLYPMSPLNRIDVTSP